MQPIGLAATMSAVRHLHRFVRRISPATWASAAALWTLGAVLAWIGTTGDERGWWADRPFTTNLLSGITTASLGIPFALIVLNRLSLRQRSHADEFDLMENYRRSLNHILREVDLTATVIRGIPLALGDIPPRYTDDHSSTVERWHGLAQGLMEAHDVIGNESNRLFDDLIPRLGDSGHAAAHQQLRLTIDSFLENVAPVISYVQQIEEVVDRIAHGHYEPDGNPPALPRMMQAAIELSLGDLGRVAHALALMGARPLDRPNSDAENWSR